MTDLIGFMLLIEYSHGSYNSISSVASRLYSLVFYSSFYFAPLTLHPPIPCHCDLWTETEPSRDIIKDYPSYPRTAPTDILSSPSPTLYPLYLYPFLSVVDSLLPEVPFIPTRHLLRPLRSKTITAPIVRGSLERTDTRLRETLSPSHALR